MTDDNVVPWEDLTRQQQEQFAKLVDQYVGIDTVDDAAEYYGNKEKLIRDSRKVTD